MAIVWVGINSDGFELVVTISAAQAEYPKVKKNLQI